jgi:hypothetical protein
MTTQLQRKLRRRNNHVLAAPAQFIALPVRQVAKGAHARLKPEESIELAEVEKIVQSEERWGLRATRRLATQKENKKPAAGHEAG